MVLEGRLMWLASFMLFSCALAAQGSPSSRPLGSSQAGTNLPRNDTVREFLSKHSMERVLCPEDIAEACVAFTHFADELDASEDDYYEIKGKGIVLGIQDSQYVIFTTRCAADFTWPNHEIRWRNVHGWEDGAPELVNEGLILHGTSVPTGGDEYFAYGTTNLQSHGSWQSQDGAGTQTRSTGREERRQTLGLAREVGDFVTVDRFKGVKGELCDVALLYVPIHRESTIRLRHLGLARPKDAVRELLEKQGILFGFEFEFSCAECQKVVAGYRPRETEAFLLGFAVGIVSGAVLEGFIQRVAEVDALSARGPVPAARIDPLRRIADSGLKRQILDRDQSRCVYASIGMCNPSTCWACIAKELHIDHVVPWARGGKTVPGNLVTACAACNLSKGMELLGTWIQSGSGK